MTILIILAIIAIIIIGGLTIYNGLVRKRLTAQEAFSTMDVYLKKRHDLIPNLVETVKGYAKHESETLEGVIKARNSAISATGDARIESENQLTQALGRLFALSEAYPQLKADTQFTGLQNQLTKVEDDIAQARKYYNGTVRQYNEKCMVVPSSIIAAMFHFEQMPYFEVANNAERENVQVKF